MSVNHKFDDSSRKISLTAGILYLLTFISIPTLSLYVPVHDPNYILGPGPDTNVFIGVILELIVGLAGIGTAVALYPILKRQNGSVALGLVGARVLEAATIFAGAAFLLSIVSLRQSGAGAPAIYTAKALVSMYDRIFYVGQGLIPAIDDLLLGYLLYKSRLVPRALALIGIVGAPILVASNISVLFGLIGPRDSLTLLFAIPVALFEFSLGVLLIVKGFSKLSPLLIKLNKEAEPQAI
ncbi:MAG TPA: DUF4386 domain-containing protein [Ignavibacteriaceae bacterium]|nr:DUF4386 domain-containing protein [Ignavibacteriaceae bacterium]